MVNVWALNHQPVGGGFVAANHKKILYLHGFNSSPASFKAQLMQEHFARHQAEERLLLPQLPESPHQAMALLDSTVQGTENIAVVGSSLGGFYATWLAERHNLKAVLINPAVRPWRLLDKYVGTVTHYHTGEPYEFEPRWVDDLKRYEVPLIERPENLLLLQQTGDETLAWRDAWDYYQECHTFKGLGGNHAFEGFSAFIPLVLQFCGLQLS